MDETVRQILAIAVGLAFVVWQASQNPGRAFAAILLVAALGYAFGPVIRHGAA